MWYICDGCDIHVICCVCSDRKQKTKNFGHFAECNTRQRAFAECLLPWHWAKLPKKCATRSLCRVPLPWHSAKLCTLPCVSQLCRHLAKNFPKKIFFLCRVPSHLDTRQRIFKKKKFFAECRVRKALGKGFFKKKGKTLPSAFLTRPSAKTPSTADVQFSLSSPVLALGKAFAECPTRQRTLRRMRLCRLLFAECGTRQSLCRVQ